jgi:uncharacterized membrane protein YphA (DoxX/SURF4 family)
MDVLRMFLGTALCIKGVYFIINTDSVVTLVGDAVPQVELTVWYVVAAHAVGGAAIALGIGTRLAVLANLPVLAGALWFVHVPRGLFAADQGLEFSFLVFVLLLLLLWHGAGRVSFDRWARAEG